MDSQWLKMQFRLHPRKSKAGLAKAVGLEPPAISKILGGARQIKAAEYHAMRRYFGLPVDGEGGFYASKGSTKSYVLQPLSEPDSHQQEESWIIPASLIERRTDTPPDQIRVFPIQDNTMAPEFKSGEHVLVDLSDTKPSPPGIFVISDGVGHIIRQCEILPNTKPLKVRLRASNTRYESHDAPLRKTVLIGRVIAKLQWM